MDYALHKTRGKAPTVKVERGKYIEAVNAAIENNNIGRLSNVLSKRYDAKYNGSDIHISPFKVSSFQKVSELSFENSVVAPINSINEIYYLT